MFKKIKGYFQKKNKVFYHLTLLITIGMAAFITWKLSILILMFDICMNFKFTNLLEISFNKVSKIIEEENEKVECEENREDEDNGEDGEE